MVRYLLLAAVFVTRAAALFESCNCGPPVVPVSGSGSQYCPTSGFAYCNTTLLKEENCQLSCNYPRSRIAFRNGSTIWRPADTITCKDGKYTTESGVSVLMTDYSRPTCAVKYACDGCPLLAQETCAAGMTCKSSNLITKIQPDGCDRALCQDGSLKLYQDNVEMTYQTSQLYCTTSGKWANISVDGGTSGGMIPVPFSVNCVLPKTCEYCVEPKKATTLSQLPVAFRTGYVLAAPTHFKENETCSMIQCAEGYTLLAMNGSSTTGTGLEYTSNGYLKCNVNSKWANGGLAPAPANITTACVAPATPTTTPRPTTVTTKAPTTVWPCGAFDELILSGATKECTDGQTRVVCPAGKKIEIIDTASVSSHYETMTFIAGKGWLSFDCDGSARLWKTGANEITIVACEDSV